MASARFPRGIDNTPGSLPTWLDLIHECNRLRPGMFGAPDRIGDWWAGGEVEEYPTARVLHRADGTVSVASTTADGALTLVEAARNLGVNVTL